MKKDKSILILFLLGLICERYIFPLLDIGIGLISNNFSLKASKTQKEINDIALSCEETNINAIWFELHHNEDSLYDDFEDKNKNKIGFIKE